MQATYPAGPLSHSSIYNTERRASAHMSANLSYKHYVWLYSCELFVSKWISCVCVVVTEISYIYVYIWMYDICKNGHESFISLHEWTQNKNKPCFSLSHLSQYTCILFTSSTHNKDIIIQHVYNLKLKIRCGRK